MTANETDDDTTWLTTQGYAIIDMVSPGLAKRWFISDDAGFCNVIGIAKRLSGPTTK